MDTSITVLIILVILILAGFILFPFLHMWAYNVKKVFVDPVLAEKRLQVLKQQFSEIDKYFDGKATEKNSEGSSRSQKTNSTCPKCGSTNVNHRIKRVQGKIDGDIYGSSSFFGGSLSGSLHGEMDTNEVNKCNGCQNEWKVDKYKYSYGSKLRDESINRVYYYFYWIEKANKVEFDKNDLSEKFSSLQEKRKFEMDKALNDSWSIREIKEIWGNYSIELFEYIFKEHHESYQSDFYSFYDPKLLENLGIKHIDEFIKTEENEQIK